MVLAVRLLSLKFVNSSHWSVPLTVDSSTIHQAKSVVSKSFVLRYVKSAYKPRGLSVHLWFLLVHRRVTPSIKFVGTHSYTWVERGTVRVKDLA